MKNKISIIVISFLGILLFSCSNSSESKPEENNTTITFPKELLELNQRIKDDSKNSDLYHKRAQYFVQQKDFQSALDDMLSALNLDSTKAPYYLTLADIYFAGNKTGTAKIALERAVKLNDKNQDAVLKLAELYLYVKQHDKSIEYINKVLRLDESNPKAYFMKGMNYKELKDTLKAISSMQTAVEQDKTYYNAYMQLGILCAAQKNKLAPEYFKNAIRLDSKSVEAWYGLGKYYQDVQDFKNAIETYNSLLKFDNNKNAKYNLGVIYFLNVKDYKNAIQYYSDAINVDPKYVEAYYARGVCYETMKYKAKAIADYKACLAINANFELAQISLSKLEK